MLTYQYKQALAPVLANIVRQALVVEYHNAWGDPPQQGYLTRVDWGRREGTEYIFTSLKDEADIFAFDAIARIEEDRGVLRLYRKPVERICTAVTPESLYRDAGYIWPGRERHSHGQQAH